MIMILPACSALPSKQALWPADLPPQEYFLSAYQQDAINHQNQSLDEYLGWVSRFYQGTEFYPNGWDNITRSILSGVTQPDKADEVKDKMQQLGLLISGEWAKNNRTRLITSRHVAIWGNALIKSQQNGETLELLERVSADVEGLLEQRIAAEDITEDRFYAEEDVLDLID